MLRITQDDKICFCEFVKIDNAKFNINEVIWNGDDEFGKPVSSGVYFYQVKTAYSEITKRILLLK
jgi:hypothetical protein